MNYSTTFPATENPISESSNWVNGLAVGLDWANVRTTTNLAFGTQNGAGGTNDSTAILIGTWGASQTGTAVVHVANQQAGNIFEEVEIRLRSTITAHVNNGYEVTFSAKAASDPLRYVQVNRWNGAFNDYTLLDGITGPGLANGDTVKATIVGNVITAFINGSQILQVTDSTYSSGNPGIGFYLQGGTSALNPDFGFTSFTASDGQSSSNPVVNARKTMFTRNLFTRRLVNRTFRGLVSNSSGGGGSLAVMSANVAKSATPTTSGTTLTLAVDCTGANALYFDFLMGVSGTFGTTSATYNGVAMTLVATLTAAGFIRLERWRLLAPASGTHDVVITVSGTTISGALGIGIPMTGVNKTTPEGTSNTFISGSTNSSGATVSSATGELVLASVYVGTDPATTSGVGQTLVAEIASPASSLFRIDSMAGAASVTPSFTWTGNFDTMCLVTPIKP